MEEQQRWVRMRDLEGTNKGRQMGDFVQSDEVLIDGPHERDEFSAVGGGDREVRGKRSPAEGFIIDSKSFKRYTGLNHPPRSSLIVHFSSLPRFYFLSPPPADRAKTRQAWQMFSPLNKTFHFCLGIGRKTQVCLATMPSL